MLISKLLRFAAVFVLVGIVSIPLAELAFRLMGDRPSEDLQGLFIGFGDGGYKLAPNVNTEATWAAGKFTVCTDDLGLRCDEQRKLAVKPGTRLDVLFIGDSQGFGHGVSFEGSLAGAVAMQAALEKRSVANASAGGHGARNQLELIRWLREKQDVSAKHYVVLATPVFAQNTDSYAKAIVGDDGRLYSSSHGTPTGLARVRLALKTSTVLYGRLRDAYLNSSAGRKPRQDSDTAFQIYSAQRNVSDSSERLKAFLSELKAFAGHQGSDVALVYVPLTVEADFKSMQQGATSRGLKLDKDLPARVCDGAASELGVPFFDLRPVVAGLHAQGDSLRLKGDFHYNPALSRACASNLWQNLSATLKN